MAFRVITCNYSGGSDVKRNLDRDDTVAIRSGRAVVQAVILYTRTPLGLKYGVTQRKDREGESEGETERERKSTSRRKGAREGVSKTEEERAREKNRERIPNKKNTWLRGSPPCTNSCARIHDA